MKLIKKIIPKHIKVFLYEKYKNHQLNEKYKNLKKYKKIFVFGSPDHGNLGDHAITKGQV